MNLIKLEGVCKRFGEKNLFNNLSMEIEQGEFVSIMGESGAGKTTLLNIIGMLEPPDRGNVTVCGQQSSSFSSRTATLLRRNHISYLMQNYGLIDTETVKYNLSISVHFKKLSKAKKKQLYSSALERVGLPGYEKRKIYTLSGGEQQRIALAKIMVKSPQLILADEPTGSLDARNRDIVLAMLRQLNEEGKTIVVVTHDPTVSACAKRHINLG
ncbi:MAG: ABC transporter ATP-binding protein [[Eubacterium] rectale]|jgi:putative ABC transport system ATP-binding protein|nr:ABC transporter ATP-binding protein [Agathobacter rectalis]HJH85887.1 putative bacteriocin export ABC transporter [Clostridiales bacterium]